MHWLSLSQALTGQRSAELFAYMKEMIAGFLLSFAEKMKIEREGETYLQLSHYQIIHLVGHNGLSEVST
jgi:hypothetical protein